MSARRGAAAVALCKGKATAHLGALRKLLEDEDRTVRLRAAQGLASLGERQAVPALIALLKEDDRPQTVPEDFKMNAIVAALARKGTDLGDLPQHPGWREIKPNSGVPAWTDDYSNILGAILRKKLGR